MTGRGRCPQPSLTRCLYRWGTPEAVRLDFHALDRRAQSGDHEARSAVSLATELPIAGIAIPQAHHPAPLLGPVEARPVNGMDAEEHHVAAVGGARHGIFDAVLVRWQMG